MKSECVRFAAQCLAAVGLLTLVGCQSAPDTTPAGAGARVVGVEGRARATDASRAWHYLRADDTLSTGLLLQTAVASSLDFAVAVGSGTDADRILLQADSVLVLEALPQEAAAGATADIATVKLHLRQGELTFTSPQSGTGPACELRLANGLASAHGATFSLRADGHAKVFHGAVALKTSDDNQTRTVPTGNQFDPRTNELT